MRFYATRLRPFELPWSSHKNCSVSPSVVKDNEISNFLLGNSKEMLSYFNLSHHHHHHHHISFMELGHLLTRSGLTYPEVSSRVYHDSFCQLGRSISLPWVFYFEAFYLHVVSNFSFIPVIFPNLVLFLTLLQFVHLFCNLSKCILLFFSCISSLMLLFFWRHLPNSPSFAAI